MSYESTFSVFGAAPDTGNLGVTALLYGSLTGLARSLPGFTPVVFDHGRGIRRETIDLKSQNLEVLRCGAYLTKRFYRPEALQRIRASLRFGGMGTPAARLMAQSAAILDLSGGDSFTDLYGDYRFQFVTLPKVVTLEAGLPLFLLPQTYGPFFDPGRRRIAQDILRRTAAAWARDPWSYNQLQELLGDDFDPDRHREGVDVAFMMESSPPLKGLSEKAEMWIEDPSVQVAGINVSGLLYNGGEEARFKYGFKSDYQAVITRLVDSLVKESDWKVALVPHVTVAEDRPESDTLAARLLAEEVGQPDRVVVIPSYRDPRDSKWVISRLDWFCGTRMHSTIASMSSGVPTAAMAYSDKTLGVFQTCGLGDYVSDLRKDDTDEVVSHAIDAWRERDKAKAILADKIPDVIARAQSQMVELAVAVADGPRTLRAS